MSDSHCDYEWRTGKSCVYKNFVHLVLVTKYRRNVITHEMLLRIKELIEETCKQMDAQLIEISGEDDHIHMIVNVHPKYSIASFVGKIKGKTSYFLRREYWSIIKQKLWGHHFWSPSYCVVSCGGAPIEIVRQYIENQRKPTPAKHAKKSQSSSSKEGRRPKKPKGRSGFAANAART